MPRRDPRSSVRMRPCPALSFAICGAALAVAAMTTAGCGSRERPDREQASAGDATPNGQATAAAGPQEPDPQTVWAELVERADLHLDREEPDQARARLAELDKLLERLESPAEDRQKTLAALKGRLDTLLREQIARTREQRLAQAADLLDQGKYEGATEALNEVLTQAPTAEQRRRAGEIAREIENRRRARRELGAYMQLLGSSDAAEVRAAQSQLARRASDALPLLLEAVQRTDDPRLVAHALELLRRLDRPDATLPAIVGVLRRAEQQENWPHAVRELSRTGRPGAGRPLLELALSATSPEQRVAALDALSVVVDPPSETLVALLPVIHSQGAELAAALRAAHHAVEVHGQHDLVARRGLPPEPGGEQKAQLKALPARLEQITAAGRAGAEPDEAAQAAQVLAVALRLAAPQPIAGIKIASASAESETSRAAAVVDGVWDSVEPETMWRYPVDRRGSLIVDLGSVRTVVGVRLWNLNEPGRVHRGWKEVDVYIGETSSALTPVAAGVVPAAPGAAGTPDYGTTLSVPFAHGRYLRLEARSVWRPDSHAGLSEVQVLGF